MFETQRSFLERSFTP